MIDLLVANPLLLLFLVAGIGYPLGRIRIWGNSLGVATVLFVGLAIGSLHPDLKLPEIVYMLGLAIFVYTIGLWSGPSLNQWVRSVDPAFFCFCGDFATPRATSVTLASGEIDMIRTGFLSNNLSQSPLIKGD